MWPSSVPAEHVLATSAALLFPGKSRTLVAKEGIRVQLFIEEKLKKTAMYYVQAAIERDVHNSPITERRKPCASTETL